MRMKSLQVRDSPPCIVPPPRIVRRARMASQSYEVVRRQWIGALTARRWRVAAVTGDPLCVLPVCILDGGDAARSLLGCRTVDQGPADLEAVMCSVKIAHQLLPWRVSAGVRGVLAEAIGRPSTQTFHTVARRLNLYTRFAGSYTREILLCPPPCRGYATRGIYIHKGRSHARS